jgi:hypothetical protein
VSTVVLQASGPLPPAEAWERYALPHRWPEWLPQVNRVELPVERITPGVRGKLHAAGGVRIGFVIDAVDEAARTWSWTLRLALLKLTLEHWVQDGPDGGSTAGMRSTGPGPIVAAYSPVAQTALDVLVRPVG